MNKSPAVSKLENLADGVRALGTDGNRAQQLVTAMSREFDSVLNNLSGLRHLGHLSGMSEAREHLVNARRHASMAASYLQSLQQGADAFADYLVGDTGTPTIMRDGSNALASLVGTAAMVDASIGSPCAGSSSTNASSQPFPAVSRMTLNDIQISLGLINPKFGSVFDPMGEYQTNCGHVAANVYDMLNGQPAQEAMTGTLTIPEMNNRTGKSQVQMAPQDIEKTLRQAGAGAHVVVGIDRSGGDGHWFNAYFDGQTVWSIDGQSNPPIICGFPPSYETDVVRWDISL